MEFDAIDRRIEVAKQTNPWDVSFPLALTCVTGLLRCA
jgi:hypothetical protein